MREQEDDQAALSAHRLEHRGYSSDDEYRDGLSYDREAVVSAVMGELIAPSVAETTTARPGITKPRRVLLDASPVADALALRSD